jgi:shikimate dehydrogenase
LRDKKFTIFGNPVEHSISPKMHTFAIEGLKQYATYTKTLLKDGYKLKEIFLKNFDGANVTVPHKEIAYKLCDEVRGVAYEIGAVNTLINENGKMIGYNTDAEGFFRGTLEFGDMKNILLLGAGGTTRAVAIYFRQIGVNVTIVNRSSGRLEFFKKCGFETFTWENIKLDGYDLVANTTSAGLIDNSLPIPKELLENIFKKSNFAIDVIYNKKTPFLKIADEFNIPNKDGADMLLYQGVLAFDYFYEHQFELAKITSFMKKAFIS